MLVSERPITRGRLFLHRRTFMTTVLRIDSSILSDYSVSIRVEGPALGNDANAATLA